MDITKIKNYVESNIKVFHDKKIESLSKLKLNNVLKRKNPYLFKAKNVNTASEIVKSLMDAHISSNEETIFGNWLEGLAIFVNQQIYKGWKSGIQGIDLEFDKDGVRQIVSIKSGPNWANSTSLNKQNDYFKSAQKTLRTSDSKLQINPVLGICYGRNKETDQGNYHRYLGQDFWEYISGNKELYTEIIAPIGHKAKENNQAYDVEYAKKNNLFVTEFTKEYCKQDGSINWNKIIELNSKSYK